MSLWANVDFLTVEPVLHSRDKFRWVMVYNSCDTLLEPSIIWPHITHQCFSPTTLCDISSPSLSIFYAFTILCWIFRSLHLEPGITFNSFPLPFSEIPFFFNVQLKLYRELCLFISMPPEAQRLLLQVLRKGSWDCTPASFLRIFQSWFLWFLVLRPSSWACQAKQRSLSMWTQKSHS